MPPPPATTAIQRTRERLALAKGLLRAQEDVLHIQPPVIPSLAESLSGADSSANTSRGRGGSSGSSGAGRLLMQQLIRACEEGDAQGLRAILAADRGRLLVATLPATTLIMRAAMRNHTGVLHVLLDEAPEQLRKLDSVDAMGWTALALAVFFKSSACARILLAHGASPNIPNMYGRTPLHIAVGLGALDLVAILLKDAPTVAVDLQDAHGATPLVLAALQGREDIAGVLLRRGASPSVKFSTAGFTLLHLCVPEARRELFETVHQAAPRLLNAQDSFGRSALHLAVAEQQAELISLIISLGAKTDIRDTSGRTPLYCAAMQGDLRLTGALLSAPKVEPAALDEADCEGLTMLHRAIMGGFLECAQLLLDRGASASILAPGRTTLAMLAAGSSASCLHSMLAVKEVNLSVSQDARDDLQRTALHHIAANGMSECVDLLVRRKAGINAKDKDGITPLMLAVISRKGDAILRTLVTAGADVNLQDSKGYTALHYATETGLPELAVSLMSLRADPYLYDNLNRQPLHVASFQGANAVVDALLDEGVGVNSGSPESGKALHWAVRGVRVQTIQLLLARGADANAVECVDESESTVETPLDAAYSLQFWDCAAPLAVHGASTCHMLLERAAAIIQALWRLHRSTSPASPERRTAQRVWVVMGVNKRHYRAVQLEYEGRRLGLNPPAMGWFKGATRSERANMSRPAMVGSSVGTLPPELSRALVRLEIKKEVVQNLKTRQTGLRCILENLKIAVGAKGSLSPDDVAQLHAQAKRALGDAVKLRSDTGRVKEK